jgi:AhpD family alkylhydroperoxidase
MQARMKNPAMLVPEAMKAMQALAKSTQNAGVPAKTLALTHLRASQINNCGVCVDLAARHKAEGETLERLLAVSAWRETPYFTEPERAALALTEAMTRLADKSDAVPDDVWADAAKHYDEPALAVLVIAIATTNVWNRLNAATRQIAGAQSW